MNNRREALIAAAESGKFLETVYSSMLEEQADQYVLSQEIVDLHNLGLIDAVKEFDQLRNTVDGPNFFLTRRVFEIALPHLNAPVSAVIDCVMTLYRDAGQDMAAGTIVNGFVEFCANDTSRPSEAISEIEKDPDALSELLTPAIAAGSRIDNPRYLSEAIRLCRHESIILRRQAIFAIGRLHWPKEEPIPVSALTVLEQSVQRESDDQILAGNIKSAFSLLQQNSSLERQMVRIIKSALAKGNDYSLHAAAEIFGINTKDISSDLLKILLSELLHVKPENKGTLDDIDYGLAHLIRNNNKSTAIQFLEQLLLVQKDTLELEIFDSVVNEVKSDPVVLGSVTTRWLKIGEPVLCGGLQSIIGSYHGDNIKLEVDTDELDSSNPAHLIFVARKAIGYFLFQPVTAASLLISLMKLTSEEEILGELVDLLFDPLLMNYTGSALDYVKEQSGQESGKVKHAIAKALKEIEDYLKNLRSVGILPALHPSNAQREAQDRHFAELMTKSMEDATSQSAILNLFPKITLLYGSKAISYVYDKKNPPRRLETSLASHGTEMEFPRMQNIDPYGLEFMVRVFRTERLSE